MTKRVGQREVVGAAEAWGKSTQKPGLKPEGATLAKPAELIERRGRGKDQSPRRALVTAMKGSRCMKNAKASGVYNIA